MQQKDWSAPLLSAVDKADPSGGCPDTEPQHLHTYYVAFERNLGGGAR